MRRKAKSFIEGYCLKSTQRLIEEDAEVAAEPVYISFDMDVLDPAFAPGVSHREPGGMPVREAIAHGMRLREELSERMWSSTTRCGMLREQRRRWRRRL
jgi:hypothetical protein